MPNRKLEGRSYRVEYTRFDSDGNPSAGEPQVWSFLFVAKEFPELASIVASDGFNKIEYEVEGEHVFVQDYECWRHEQDLRNESQRPVFNHDTVRIGVQVVDGGVIQHQEWVQVGDGDIVKFDTKLAWEVKFK